jgi:hypothetical protein
MPLMHGSKFYCQVLLDPHRYVLLARLAEKENKRPTALMREMIYAALEKVCTTSEYNAAETADRAAWAESIKRRVEGRQRSKQEGDGDA